MKAYTKTTLLLIFGIITGLLFMGAVNPKKQKSGLAKSSVYQYKQLDGNQINCTMSSDGPYADYRKTTQSGMEWPKGSGKTPVFTAGLWMGGFRLDSAGNKKDLRMAQMDYTTDYQPGPLLPGEVFNTTTNEDSGPVSRGNDDKYRLYKVNKKDTLTYNTPDANPDYLEWPVDLGAPWIDRDGDGVWKPGVDIVKFTGDQQIWLVINDVSKVKHKALSGTDPMGVEVRILYFVFNQAGALGNMMFMKWIIENRSDSDYDSVYVGQWSDVDLGQANDDLPGVDTTLSLGYTYNGDGDDEGAAGYGTKPPACGFDFFEGPTVPGLLTDSALIDGKKYPNLKNLPATAHIIYTNGTFPQIVDPGPDGAPTYAPQAYAYLNGQAGTIQSWVTDPITKQIVKYWFADNPALPPSSTNPDPTQFPLGSFPPQDLRVMLCSGPFKLERNKPQEVVGTFLIAQGSDRFNSITALKKADMLAQQAFNTNFKVPSAPPVPPVKVTELDKTIILDWSANVDPTEKYNFKDPFNDYKFEGYALYQTDNPTNPDSWLKIGQWDLVNGILVVKDWTAHPVTGELNLLPVAYFTDNGMRYYFVIQQDYISKSPLINGKQYFFALTTFAYNYHPDALKNGVPLVIESAKDPIARKAGQSYVMPLGEAIGTEYDKKMSDAITHNRTGDDALKISVANPGDVRTAKYKMTFNGTDTVVTTWNLIRNGVDTLLKNVADFSGTIPAKYTDGVFPLITKPAPTVRLDSQTPKGYEYVPSFSIWFTGAGVDMDALSNGIIFPKKGRYNNKATTIKPQDVKKVEIRFGGANKQKAYRFASNLKIRIGFTEIVVPPADSSFIPYINRVFTNTPFQDIVEVPFTVWEIDPLDGVTTARQLNIAFVERNDSLYDYKGTYLGKGNLDGKWAPTTADSGGAEPLFIFASTYDPNDTSYSVSRKTPGPGKYLDIVQEQDSLDVYYVLHLKRTKLTANYAAGDVFRITPNYVLTDTREFEFSTTAPKRENTTVAKANLDDINVYPNPFFAYNQAQRSSLVRYVTFSHLPKRATIKIFTLNGELVRTIEHNDANARTVESLETWDLRNTNGLPVASGMYIVHIDVPNVGTKILKLGIIQPEERPTRI